MVLVILTIGLCALMLPPPAMAQLTPTTYGNFVITNSLANDTTYTVNSTAIELQKGRGITIIPFLTGVAATTNDVTINLQVSADGTNYTTSATGIALNVILANSTASNAKLFVIPPATLDNVRYLRIGTVVTTVTNAVGVTRIQYSYFP